MCETVDCVDYSADVVGAEDSGAEAAGTVAAVEAELCYSLVPC